MIYRFFVIISLIALFACESNTSAKKQTKEHKAKSVNLEEFSVIDISPNAQLDVKNWKSFQSLMQVIVSMAPTKIKNTENLVTSNPDSLLIYTRLYPKNPKTILENASVERDWRTHDKEKDTIYRFEKKKDSEISSIQWDNFLIKDIPYTFSIFVKNVSYDQVGIEFYKSGSNVNKQIFRLDTTAIENPNTAKKYPLADDWYELQSTFVPDNEGVYNIKLLLDENAKQGSNVIFFRPTLQVPTKFFSKMSQHSDKIIREKVTIESSYYSVFFWLVQIEEELKQLLAENSFPEKINVPAIKARFRLFETQVKELADNVKNNPDFQEDSIKKSIANIQHSFNGIISRINNFYDSDLDERMRYINSQLDTIKQTTIEFPKTEKQTPSSQTVQEEELETW
ncbi:MAG: hypothetical protein Q4C98_06470 [Capnocytophaga sp.]|nr:hypothetical protein [Capnocytophaga sp.]